MDKLTICDRCGSDACYVQEVNEKIKNYQCYGCGFISNSVMKKDSSFLEEQIGVFLDQFGKTTISYGIEKFHLLDKEFYSISIPKTDLNEYPEFSIHGMGISVIINE